MDNEKRLERHEIAEFLGLAKHNCLYPALAASPEPRKYPREEWITRDLAKIIAAVNDLIFDLQNRDVES
jgi:hypothetical protein